MFSFASAEIISLGLQGILYGIYLMLFFACLTVIYAKRQEGGKQDANYKLLATSVVLFVLITWHMAIDIVRLYMAYQHPTTLEADIYYSNNPAVLSVMKTTVYLAMTIIWDAFMLYRCYIVWNKRILIIIVPLLVVLTDAAFGIAAVVALHQSTQSNFYLKKQVLTTKTFFAMTLVANGLSTALIAFRIWRSQRELANMTPITTNNLNKLIIILLESGALYFTMVLLVLLTYVAQVTTAFAICFDLVAPVIGIAFSLITVRMSLGFRHDGSKAQQHFSTVIFRRTYPSHHVQKDTFEMTSTKASAGVSSKSPGTTVLGSQSGSMDKFNGHGTEAEIVFAGPVA